MNHETALASGRQIFKAETLPFTSIPDQSKIFLDFESELKSVSKFYPHVGREESGFIHEMLSNYKTDRDYLCDILSLENERYGAETKTLENIEKLRDKDCVAVLTGQQAGLFGGPVYTIYKALTAVKYAENLVKRGVKAVPVFWVASEDHDFEEIRKTFLVDEIGFLKELSNLPEDLVDSLPVSDILIDESIDATIRDLEDFLPNSEFKASTVQSVKKSYSVGHDFSSAFTSLLRELLSGYGLIFVSPQNSNIRKLSSAVFKQAIEQSNEIRSRLLSRKEELIDAGYHNQVHLNEEFFPFFYLDDSGRRKALRYQADTDQLTTDDSDLVFTIPELAEVAQDASERLSPNALMRPVVQDYLFPTAMYFGGAAEIAYFGQNSVVYEVLGRPTTPIQHRFSATIIEPKHRRTLGKYEIGFHDLFAGRDNLLGEIVKKFINADSARVLEKVEGNIDRELNKLDSELAKVDQTLSDSLKNRRKKIEWHLETLTNKFVRAELARDEVIKRQIESLFESVFPKSGLQERALNGLYFTNRYGENFFAWIYDQIDFEKEGHKVLTL